MIDLQFFRNKRVLLTGHTGFKGTWLSKVLLNAGANVTGYSLDAPTIPSIFKLSEIQKEMNSIHGDVRNLELLERVFTKVNPEIVIHLAAQPLVRESYLSPHTTFETNVMGTVNMLECIRKNENVVSFLNVTTDKVYENKEWEWGYRENDRLGGFDPYSNSKSCSELVTLSYINSFFAERPVAISTARAGNVIGGGDFAADRIIPDCVRAAINNTDIIVRNPHSIRPYQHVLEPVIAYLLIVQKQYENNKHQGFYNIGPDDSDCITTGRLADLFCHYWGSIKWVNVYDGGPHEAKFLKLDCSKIKNRFDWKPVWNVENAVQKTVEWTKVYLNAGDNAKEMDNQIKQYLSNDYL